MIELFLTSEVNNVVASISKKIKARTRKKRTAFKLLGQPGSRPARSAGLRDSILHPQEL